MKTAKKVRQATARVSLARATTVRWQASTAKVRLRASSSAFHWRTSAVLLFILFFSFVVRIYRLNVPERYIFDEVYHAVTAKLIARNDARAFEWWNPPVEPDTAVDWLHPPLAKYTQALSIRIFGETSLGWRLSSALFGVGVIYLTYRLARELFEDERKEKAGADAGGGDSEWTAILAAGLAALDGLLLVQSRIAMNDIHVSFFILLTLIFYQRYLKTSRQDIRLLITTGLIGGLAVGSKWSGAFALVVVGVFEVGRLAQTSWHLFKTKKYRQLIRNALKKKLQLLIFLIVLPAVIYVLSYSLMFVQGKNWSHFRELHRQIWYYQTHLTATHTYQSRPWQWVLNLRPVWYHVNYDQPADGSSGQPGQPMIANIYAFGNPALFWLALPWLMTTPIAIFIDAEHRRKLLLIMISYLAVWAGWIFSPRIMFFYHYTPAVPLFCIIFAYWLRQIWQLDEQRPGNRIAVGVMILIIVATFVIWFPNWTAIPVKVSFANSVYFWLPNWK